MFLCIIFYTYFKYREHTTTHRLVILFWTLDLETKLAFSENYAQIMLKTPLLLRLFVVLKTHLSAYHLVSLYTRHRLSAKLRILHTVIPSLTWFLGQEKNHVIQKSCYGSLLQKISIAWFYHTIQGKISIAWLYHSIQGKSVIIRNFSVISVF